MKVIIAGGRDFADYDLVKEKLDNLFQNIKKENLEIISGRCSRGILTFTTSEEIQVYGADGLGDRYAFENNIPVIPMPADWKIGKKAGVIRNEEMAKIANSCVVFWDGKSPGSKNMIENAKKYKLNLRIIRY